MNLTRPRTSRRLTIVDAVVAVTACGADGGAGDSTSGGDATGDDVAAAVAGDWIATVGIVGDAPVTLLPSGPITLEIDAESDRNELLVSGRAACNSYGGRAMFGAINDGYDQQAHRLRFVKLVFELEVHR